MRDARQYLWYHANKWSDLQNPAKTYKKKVSYLKK